MKTKGLTKEEALKQLEIINKTIEFNNAINKEARRYMKDTGLENTFNGYRDQATPEMLDIMDNFLNHADWMPENMKSKYLSQTSNIFGRVWSIAQNRDWLKDKKDCESFLKTFERAENNAEEENSLFRVERNTETTRMNLYFDGKPEQEVIDQLKHNGFKWSPKMSCWTRQLTANAEWSLKHLKEALKEQIELADNKEISINPNLVVSESTNNELISYRDYIKDLPFGPYVDNTERIKEARQKFNNDIKNCDVVLVETSKSYDPEGISSDWADDNIMYAGDLDSVKSKLNEIIENAKNDKYQSVTKFNEDTYQIYYENAISKVTYTLMDNPLKEKYSALDMQSVQTTAKANGYNLLSFDYVSGNYVTEKEGIVIKNDINGKELLFTKYELDNLRKKAWNEEKELSNMGKSSDKALNKAIYFDNLISDYDKKFSVLKDYPNVDYVIARNNNLNAPEPYVAAYQFNRDTHSWGQGHYFTNLDDTLKYMKGVENNWLNNVDPDVLLNTIRNKLNENEITVLENSIYNKDSGKEI